MSGPESGERRAETGVATFGLVHGAYHGSWCWERLLPDLEHLGHIGLTVDLPCDDPNAGAREYAAPAQEAFAGAPDDLVLVGHSLGGSASLSSTDSVLSPDWCFSAPCCRALPARRRK